MKRLPKKEEMKTSLIKRFFRILIVLIILFAIGVITLLFTNYRGLGDQIKAFVKPTIPNETKTREAVIQENDTIEVYGNTEDKDSSLFQFNTQYEQLDTLPWSSSDSIVSVNIDTVENEIKNNDDLTAKALLADPSEEDTISIVQEVRSSEFLLSEDKTEMADLDGSSRIIAIAGKNLLLNKNRDDQESIILILAESASIKSISVSDVNGTILFSSDQKNLGKSLPDDFQANYLVDSEACKESTNTCAFPIYHTFGKLGYAIVKKENE